MGTGNLFVKRVTTTEAPWVRWTLTAVALVFLLLFLVLPLAAVFAEALRKGLGAYLEAFREPDAWSAIGLTLLTAAIAVPVIRGLAEPTQERFFLERQHFRLGHGLDP